MTNGRRHLAPTERGEDGDDDAHLGGSGTRKDHRRRRLSGEAPARKMQAQGRTSQGEVGGEDDVSGAPTVAQSAAATLAADERKKRNAAWRKGEGRGNLGDGMRMMRGA